MEGVIDWKFVFAVRMIDFNRRCKFLHRPFHVAGFDVKAHFSPIE